MLGLLPRTESGNQYLVIIIDRYSKLNGKLLATNISSTHVAHTVFKHYVIANEIPDFILSQNGQQFVSRCFITFCSYLDVKKSRQLRSSRRRINKRKATPGRLYHDFECTSLMTNEIRTYSSVRWPLLTIVNDNSSSFSMTLTRPPPGPVMIVSPTIRPTTALTAKCQRPKGYVFLSNWRQFHPWCPESYAKIRVGIDNILTKILGRSPNFLLDNLSTWTLYHWSRYLPRAMLTNIMNYDPEHMASFNCYRIRSTRTYGWECHS